MQVELAQLALVDGDTEYNTRRVIETIDNADVAGGTQMIVFPETALSGFPTPENIARVAQASDSPALGAVVQAAKRRKVSVALGIAEFEGGHYYNSNMLIDRNGQTVMQYRKTHLWSSDFGVFEAGNSFESCVWEDLRLGLLICYDIEFPETARALAALGTQLAIVTDGNMNPYGPVHRRASVARAMENQMFVAIVNRCGSGENGLTFPGESALIDPYGDVVASAGAQETVLKVTVDLTKLDACRQHYRYLDDRRVLLGLKPKISSGDSRSSQISDEFDHRNLPTYANK